MTYQTPQCPECGKLLRDEVDWIPGCALAIQRDDGTFQYAGETDVFWDGQMNAAQLLSGQPDTVRVVECSKGHTWETTVTFESDQ